MPRPLADCSETLKRFSASEFTR